MAASIKARRKRNKRHVEAGIREGWISTKRKRSARKQRKLNTLKTKGSLGGIGRRKGLKIPTTTGSTPVGSTKVIYVNVAYTTMQPRSGGKRNKHQRKSVMRWKKVPLAYSGGKDGGHSDLQATG